MQERSIVFREIALFDPKVYQALVKESVATFEHDSTYHFVGTNDALNKNYPELCKALRDGGFSYAVHSRRDVDGSHDQWKFSFTGSAEEVLTEESHIDFIRRVKK